MSRIEKAREFRKLINANLQATRKLIRVDDLSEDELLDDDIETLIKERDDARANKNFARSDEIRDLLAEQGIILEDTPQGTRWHRQ